MAQPMSQNPYMTVPDKIELSSTAVPPFSARNPVGGDQGPRYMQIPDTITLGGGAPSQSGGQSAPDDQVHDNLGRVQNRVEEVPMDQPKLVSESGEVFGVQANTHVSAEFEQRLRLLENRVQHLSEELQDRPRGAGVSNFWYVMTFATWMLLPLISVIMYRYKK